MGERPAADGDLFNPEPRIGWLLRSSRLVGLPDTSARQFADLLAQEGVSADASRVSRWETGQVPAPFALLEAYERLVDLDPGGLRAVAAFQRRVGTGRVLTPGMLSPSHMNEDWLERMLDAVVDGDPDGRTWLEFGQGAACAGTRLVLPRSMWRSLANRLLGQVSVSIGAAYLGRSEGAILLTTHPSARRALLHAIGEIVTEPDIPIVSDAMTLLQEVDGPHANDLVMRLLTHEDEPTRNAAARVAATKVGRSHFDAAELARLGATAFRLTRIYGLDRNGSFGGLVDLVDLLPGRGAEGGASLDPDTAGVATFVDGVVHEVDQDEPMLIRLAGLTLEDHRLEHRFLAAFTVHQSPFRAGVARAAARTVQAHAEGRSKLDPELAHRLMVLLSVVSGPAEAEFLLRLAEDRGSALQPMALAAVGHLAPLSGFRRPRLEPLLDGDDAVSRAATYCAGMSGDPLLHRLVARADVGESRRRAAQWWIDHGPAIYEAGPARRVGRS